MEDANSLTEDAIKESKNFNDKDWKLIHTDFKSRFTQRKQKLLSNKTAEVCKERWRRELLNLQ